MADITYLQLFSTLGSTAIFYELLSNFALTAHIAPIATLVFCCGVVYMFEKENVENAMR